jgi:long-chain acyl-CoA synthetase
LTSGSTGRPKAVVHDFSRLIEKFRKVRPAMVMVNFLLFDHWGGINTLLGALSSGTMIVLPEDRSPDEICKLIERYRIELLPATPTFLNMLLISRAFERADLSSLKLITYGAEPMPESTLRRLREVFPKIELRQTYGMIELGVMRAKSKSSDSLWVKLGGEGYQLRVTDGILQIKADAAMLGYLNAPSPFTADGYFITGDRVEQQGEYLKILGRDSDLINVGGQKVYPAEVETVILEMPEVRDAVVYGESHILTGKIVCADVIAADDVDATALRQKIKLHCASKLQPFMVPVRINFPKEGIYTTRLKRRRDR